MQNEDKNTQDASAAQPTAATSPSQTHEVQGIGYANLIPTFWRDNVRLWFHSFEFATSGLKKSQFQLAQLLIAQLQLQDVEQVSDLISNPSETPYHEIKQRLISVYEDSEHLQLQKLLQHIELGSQRPSQLLRKMRTLARNTIPDSTLRMMWMNHLPPHVRSVLLVSDSISKTTALDDLALLADKMSEQMTEVAAISDDTMAPKPSPAADPTKFLIDEIRKLSLEVAEIKRTNFQPRARSPYRRDEQIGNRRYHSSRQRNSSRTRHNGTPTLSPYCFYHRKFGADARRCTSPCNFNAKSGN